MRHKFIDYNYTVDLIICDGAPEITGLHNIDEYSHSQLLNAAFNVCCILLKSHGTYIAKLFKTDNINYILSQYKLFFDFVDLCKPNSSRSKSTEHFIVCKGFKPENTYKNALLHMIENNSTTIDYSLCTKQQIQYMNYLLYGSLDGDSNYNSNDGDNNVDDTTHNTQSNNTNQHIDYTKPENYKLHPYLQFLTQDISIT